jgi:transcriptional regulator with XRE-family HTH domain
MVREFMQEPVYSFFGSRVRALRERRKVTQEELARRVDLSRTSITNIEQGRQRVLLHQIFEIATALDAAPGDLLPKNAAASERPLREDVAKIVEALKGETSPS